MAVERRDLAAVEEIQRKIDRMMSIYSVGMPFVPFIKRAMELRGIGVRSYASQPLPQATAEDDEKLLAIMKNEGLLKE